MGKSHSKNRFSAFAFVLPALIAACGPRAAQAAAAMPASLSSTAPAGFDALERPQTAMVDVYAGGVRVTSTLARYRPGFIQFLKPGQVRDALPHLKRSDEVDAALGEEMSAHADKTCIAGGSDDCGRLAPAVAAVIFDEARFRVDVFVNPAYLEVADPLASHYLPAPDRGFGGLSVTGGIVSGGTTGPVAYGLQNRTVISYGAVRVVSEVSQSSGDGFRVDTLAVSADRGPLRYQAGLLWAPTLDFFGQGRILGASVGTQLDTLANRDLIAATPVLIYLDQRSQVEIYRAGRLLAARSYDAGNQLIDTAGLPDGSYEIVVRIRPAGGAVREERRFFSRNRALPPLGRPQFQVTAGSLLREDVFTGRRGGNTGFAQVSYARRLSQRLAMDGAVSVIGGDPAAALGASWASGGLRLRALGLGSGRGEYGALAGAAVNLGDRGVLAVDVRRAWGREAAADAAAVQDVSGVSLTGLTDSRYGFTGAGTQATASLSTVWRGAQMALTGSYSAYRGSRSAYAFGGSVEAPLALRRFEGLRLYVSAAETDRGAEAYVGLRFRMARGRMAAYGDAGYGISPKTYGQGSGPVADVAANRETTTRWGELATNAAYAHTPERDTVSAGAQLRSIDGDVGGEIDQDLRGRDGGTRYTANFLVGAAFAGGRPSLASAQSGDSGMVVRVSGVEGVRFRVLVDDSPVAVIRSGRSTALLLPGYRAYRVRLAPMDGAAVDFDTAERRVSLFPGNMARLDWVAREDVEVFGRVVDEHGAPLSDAAFEGVRAPVSTDGRGYFQATLARGRDMTLRTVDGRSCRIALGALRAVNGYATAGTRVCRLQGDAVRYASNER